MAILPSSFQRVSRDTYYFTIEEIKVLVSLNFTVAAYHLKWDDSMLERNIGNWAVNVIQLSREKRHLDRARMMMFWETLDK